MKVREEGINWYLDMLVEKLGGELAKEVHDRGSDREQGEVTVNILHWLNFTSFDIMGHMVYCGEPFGCLRREEYHPCVALIIGWLKATGIIFSIRLYAPLDRVLLWLMPPSLVKLRDEFERLGWDRVRRLKRIVDRDVDKVDETEIEDEKGLGKATHSNLMSHQVERELGSDDVTGNGRNLSVHYRREQRDCRHDARWHDQLSLPKPRSAEKTG